MKLNRRKYTFGVHDLGEQKGAFGFQAKRMPTGQVREVESLFSKEIGEFASQVGGGYASVPFVFPKVENNFLGDYSTIGGQSQFWNMCTSINTERFKPPASVKDVWRFSELFQDVHLRQREICACLRGLSAFNGSATFSVGAGMFEEAFCTMNSCGLEIGLSKEDERRLAGLDHRDRKELKILVSRLIKKHGKGTTVRGAIHKTLGRLPSFNQQVFSHILGVSGMVVTIDKQVLFVERTPRTTSLNYGINVAVSGGTVFEEEKILSHGLPLHLVHTVLKELKEEVGILGSQCAVVPVGFLRELVRGGSPEFFFLVRFHGTADDLVRLMRGNKSLERDADRFIYTLPLQEARSLIREPQACGVIHNKAVANLILVDRYLHHTHNE